MEIIVLLIIIFTIYGIIKKKKSKSEFQVLIEAHNQLSNNYSNKDELNILNEAQKLLMI